MQAHFGFIISSYIVKFGLNQQWKWGKISDFFWNVNKIVNLAHEQTERDFTMS